MRFEGSGSDRQSNKSQCCEGTHQYYMRNDLKRLQKPEENPIAIYLSPALPSTVAPDLCTPKMHPGILTPFVYWLLLHL